MPKQAFAGGLYGPAPSLWSPGSIAYTPATGKRKWQPSAAKLCSPPRSKVRPVREVLSSGRFGGGEGGARSRPKSEMIEELELTSTLRREEGTAHNGGRGEWNIEVCPPPFNQRRTERGRPPLGGGGGQETSFLVPQSLGTLPCVPPPPTPASSRVLLFAHFSLRCSGVKACGRGPPARKPLSHDVLVASRQQGERPCPSRPARRGLSRQAELQEGSSTPPKIISTPPLPLCQDQKY